MNQDTQKEFEIWWDKQPAPKSPSYKQIAWGSYQEATQTQREKDAKLIEETERYEGKPAKEGKPPPLFILSIGSRTLQANAIRKQGVT